MTELERKLVQACEEHDTKRAKEIAKEIKKRTKENEEK